jgi:intron-binding protein aquarius
MEEAAQITEVESFIPNALQNMKNGDDHVVIVEA